MPSLNTVFQWLVHYRYLVLLPVAVVEGPIITVIGAFMASKGYFNVFLVYAVVVLGDLIGDAIYYLIGRLGKRPWLLKWGGWAGITPERLDKMEVYFRHHSGKVLLFGKLTHSIGWAILVAAGTAKMPFKKFLWFNLLGTLPKSLAFLLLGYYAGAAYQHIDSEITKVAIILFCVIITAIALFFLRRKYNNKEDIL